MKIRYKNKLLVIKGIIKLHGTEETQKSQICLREDHKVSQRCLICMGLLLSQHCTSYSSVR